jgi:copper chaperone NosL
LSACGTTGGLRPVDFDPGETTCTYCRMQVGDRRLASQLLMPGEEPRFFDDIGCLTRYLAESHGLGGSVKVWVADHRTGQWTPAEQAVYTSTRGVTASMGSHVIAHASLASRDADPDAAGGVPVDVEIVLPR